VNKIFASGLALLGLAAVGLAGPISEGSVNVSPGGTFLDQSANDTCSYVTHSVQCTGAAFFAPTFVDLTALNTPVNGGDTLFLFITGNICYLGANCGTPNLGGIFSSTNTFLDSTHLNRVQNSISAGGSGYVTATYFSLDGTTNTAANNTNPNDFIIPGGTSFSIVVPNGAKFLVLGVYDSFYADNSGNISVGLSVIQSATPEPGTYLLIAGGLAALGFIRKFRA
jgi:hypothetical protein